MLNYHNKQIFMKILYSLSILILTAQLAPSNAFSDGRSIRQWEGDFSEKIYEASKIQKKALQYYEKKYGLFSVETLKPMEALAWMSMEQGDFQEAENLYRRVINIRNTNVPPSVENSESLGTAYFLLGDSYLYRKQYILAETNYDQSFSLAEDPGHRGDVLSRKGIIYQELKKYEDAINFYLEAVDEYAIAKESNPRKMKQINKRILNAYSALSKIYKKRVNNEKYAEYQNLVDAMKAGGEIKQDE